MTDHELGVLIGVLIGEGSFGGDGKQAQITVRMHARHETLLRWLATSCPGSKLYGPYNHGGRHYFQWMARGEALKTLLDHLENTPWAALDPYSHNRYQDMKAKYGLGRQAQP